MLVWIGFLPYLYSGTNIYDGGMFLNYVGFEENAKDQRPGVFALVNSVMKRESIEVIEPIQSKPIQKFEIPKPNNTLK